MGMESHIASMAMDLSAARVASAFSLGILKRGLESSELAAAQMLGQINNYCPVSANEIGGLLDANG